MLGFKTKAEKQKIVEANKVVFDPGHPIWGIKGIPDWQAPGRKQTTTRPMGHMAAEA